MAPIVGQPTYQRGLASLPLFFLLCISACPGSALGISQLRSHTKEASARYSRAARTESDLVEVRGRHAALPRPPPPHEISY